MKKLFSALLFSVMMVVFVTPVFAVEGEGSASSDVEYVVEGSFTWSVPAKITVGSDAEHKGTGVIEITNSTLSSDKAIALWFTGCSNYNNGFNLKKVGDNTLYPYILGMSTDEIESTPFDSEPTELAPKSLLRTAVHGIQPTYIQAWFNSEDDKPTTAGTYADTLTFEATVYDAN